MRALARGQYASLARPSLATHAVRCLRVGVHHHASVGSLHETAKETEPAARGRCGARSSRQGLKGRACVTYSSGRATADSTPCRRHDLGRALLQAGLKVHVMQDGRAMPGSGGPLHLHDAISEASGALAASTHVARRDDRRTPRRREDGSAEQEQKVGERRGHEIIVVKSKQGKQGNVVQLARGCTWCMTCLVLRSEMKQQADEAAVAGRLAAASWWAVESPGGVGRGRWR